MSPAPKPSQVSASAVMVAGLAQYDEQSDESFGSFEIPPAAGDNCCYRLQWSAVILHGDACTILPVGSLVCRDLATA